MNAFINKPMKKTMGVLEWGMLLALSMLWGAAFFFNGLSVRELPALSVVTVRVVLAASILLVFVRASGQRMPTSPAVWAAFFGMGLLNNAVPFTLIAWGQTHIASGVASILNATTPLFTVLVAHVCTADERLTGGRLFGVALGLFGVAAMIGGDALQSLGLDVVAQLACLGAAISYAFAGVFGRRFRRLGVAPTVTATGQVVASSAMLIPVMLIVDQPWTLPMPSTTALLALLGIASLSTALAYILYFQILARAGATNLMLVTFLIPVSAIMLGVLALGEVLELRHLLGMALIGTGLAAIDGRLWRIVWRTPAA